jgi:hypothetical protein
MGACTPAGIPFYSGELISLAGGRLPGRPRLAPETGRRNGELALERAVESGFGLIADFGSDLCHRITRGRKHLLSQLKSPACEVCHGRLVEVMAKPLGQHRAGHSSFFGQRSNGPGMRRVSMHEGQSFSNLGIASASEPSSLLRRKMRNVGSQSFNEQNLREFGQDRFTTSSGSVGLVHRKAD